MINSYNLDSYYSFPLHSHQNHWELVYCEEGSFHHQVNGRIYTHKEGEMMFIREEDSHLLKGRDFRYSNIAFSGAWIESIKSIAGSPLVHSLTGSHRDPPHVLIPRKERPFLESRIRDLLGTERTGRRDLRFSHFLQYVFDGFLLDEEKEDLPEHIPDWLEELVRYININDNPVPDLDTLVNRSCRCAEHVSRSFRKYLGATPTQYLREARLSRAAEFLRGTNYPVKEICFLCSYENANYFHKQFREKYNMTPLEYRRSHGKRIH